MNTLPLSFDQYRRQIRRELLIKRQQDQEHSEARLFADEKLLDTLLVEAGYELVYQTEWTRKRDLNPLEADISDLNLKDMFEVGYG